MKLKSLRNMLIATTVVSSALIASVGAWAFLGRALPMPSLDVPQIVEPSTVVGQSNLEPKKTSFEGLFNLALQPPRESSPQGTAPAPMVSSSESFSIQLVGTTIDSSRSLAVFRDATGAFDSKGIGQPLELSPKGIKVESIEPRFATLFYAGRLVKLELASSEAALSGSVSASVAEATPPPAEETNSSMQSSEMAPAMNSNMNPTFDPSADLNFLPPNMREVYADPNPLSPSMGTQP